jgi:hypothetical protein
MAVIEAGDRFSVRTNVDRTSMKPFDQGNPFKASATEDRSHEETYEREREMRRLKQKTIFTWIGTHKET